MCYYYKKFYQLNVQFWEKLDQLNVLILGDIWPAKCVNSVFFLGGTLPV